MSERLPMLWNPDGPSADQEAAFEAGAKSNEEGFARDSNPVVYNDESGRYSTKRAAIRDQWFAGWDSAQSEREEWESDNAYRARNFAESL